MKKRSRLPKGISDYRKLIEEDYIYKEAKEQLARYSNSPKLKGMDNLKKWAVVFVGDQCVINEEIKVNNEEIITWQ